MTRRDLVLDSRYTLAERLATGGMGEVWRGVDELLNRPVAVKLLRQEHVSDEHARARFRAEARYAAALQHGGIAQVYDYGEHDDRAYLVMELVSGEPLSRILARNGGLGAETTLDVVAQAARALQVAHSAGIIHRDVKPGNLMVTGEGTVKITDFGIARGQNAGTLTQTGMVMGTAHYVSPEQASGRPITPATDLYSLGVVAYECLTGHPPFDAEQPVAIALMHVREVPPPLPDGVPDAVRALVDVLLSKDPEERPASAREVADEAFMIHDALLAGEPVTSSFAASAGARGAAGEHEDAFGDDLATAVLTDRRRRGGRATTALPGGRGARTSGGPPELAVGDGADTLSGATPVQRRTALVAGSVAAGVLVLGVIVVGSMMRGPASADLKETKDRLPVVTPGSTRPVPSRVPSPTGVIAPPYSRPRRSPSGSGSTSTTPTPSASPTGRPSTPPPTKTPEIPTPKPTITSPSPTPSGSAPPAGSEAGDGS
ncbi:serine/threonine-protein kinase [Thermomonospora umbrina]|uniref:non-specific serine/threonine protein kinase n=1 Tax=Thermomonospora umbrina TaxID=111806 RepID=A0A3D9STM4_9ACTN|nr:serine/threonine-protein kinase [Thermomonospora umbrina]REE97363.1 serine/threonine-protein kinase [Thermomonospora umbrina]